MRQIHVLLLIFIFLLANVMVVYADRDIPVDGGSSSRGGNKQIDFDKILKALQEGKEKKPEKFEELQALININDIYTPEYSKVYSLGLGITGNKTLTRNDKFVIGAKVVNPNPIEIRRPMYLYLEIQEPRENAFKVINPVAQIIQINEYERKDGQNSSYRNFPDLTSFSNLRTVGPVILRLKASDGQYTWYSKNLTLNVTNQEPLISDINISSISKPRYNDAIIYEANITDLDGDNVNVTLHILDEYGREKDNSTQIVNGVGQVKFIGTKYFRKSDAGKSFQYYYTYGDGMATNKTKVQDGPTFRKRVTLFVQNPTVIPNDHNQFWWDNYNFTVDMKNQDQGEVIARVTLFTNTKAHPWKYVDSKDVVLTPEMQTVPFNKNPFDVSDVNETFAFKFQYSEPDQNDEFHTDVAWDKPINAKLVKYEAISIIGVGNVLLLIALALVLSIFFERRFYR